MKTSDILLCPTVRLRALPAAELDVLRRFFLQHLRGMDAKNDRRFRRLVRRVFRAEPGEGFQLHVEEERSGPFHRRHRVILDRLFQTQERFTDIDKLHDWIKVGAGFVTWEPGRDYKPVAIPRTTEFPRCSEDEMREFHTAAVAYLRTPHALRRLFTRVKPSQREEMLETLLRNPDDDAYWETYRT